jgi:threonine dehydrogenase-like Zn-dependent dehydrogenase
MAAASAKMMGIDQIFMVDHHKYRLDFATQTYGVVPFNFDDGDAADFILQATDGRGVDGVIDAVGFEAKGSKLETVLTDLKLEGSSGKALRQCIAAVRRGGMISVPGVYAGFIHGFLFGDIFEKGIGIKAGQTHVQQHMPTLLKAIEEGKLKPNAIISHRLKLEQAAEGYKMFDKKEDNCRKVVLTP